MCLRARERGGGKERGGALHTCTCERETGKIQEKPVLLKKSTGRGREDKERAWERETDTEGGESERHLIQDLRGKEMKRESSNEGTNEDRTDERFITPSAWRRLRV